MAIFSLSVLSDIGFDFIKCVADTGKKRMPHDIVCWGIPP